MIKQSGITVDITAHGCSFQDHNQRVVAIGQKIDGLYCIQTMRQPLGRNSREESFRNSAESLDKFTRIIGCLKIQLDKFTENNMLFKNSVSNVSTVLQQDAVSNSCSKQVNFEVFHARLGHASISRLEHILGCNCKGIKDLSWEICCKAKQPKLPFPISMNKV